MAEAEKSINQALLFFSWRDTTARTSPVIVLHTFRDQGSVIMFTEMIYLKERIYKKENILKAYATNPQ